MGREILKKIDNDKEIIQLRMESEDLINNYDFMAKDDFQKEAKRIEAAIDNRISTIYKNAETNA